jgi:two-component system, sensor histidine kinase YesM
MAFPGRGTVIRFRTQLIYKLIPIILLPIITIGIFSYKLSFSALQSRSSKDVERIASLVNENLNYMINDIEQLAVSTLYDQNIQQIVSSYNSDRKYIEPDDNDNVQSYLRKMLIQNEAVQSIFIYTKGNTIFEQSLHGDLPDVEWKSKKWYKDALNSRDNAIIIPTHFIERRSQALNDIKTSVFSVARQIKNTNNFNVIGVSVFNVKLSSIERIITVSQTDSNTRFLILDLQGNWIYPNDEDAFRKNVGSVEAIHSSLKKQKNKIALNKTSYYMSSNTSAYSGWTVIALVPENSISKEVQYIKWTTVIVILITSFLIAALFFYIATVISKPVSKLRDLMKHVETGDLNIQYEAKGHGEIDELGRAFSRMIERLKQLIQDNLQAQIQRQLAELAALQSQLNPHFLYNTLEAFQMIAITEGSSRLARMSYSLGQLMRMALNAEEFSTIRQELDHINNYLVLIKERYEDRLNYEIVAPEQLMECRIPKLTLQPLVENAIYHGIDKKVMSGTVSIKIMQKECDISIEIQDDGAGIPEEKLSAICAELENEENVLKKKGNIGIANIQARIQNIFGKEYGISIRSEVGVGTTVIVKIPMGEF